jgi:pyruvate dehydrogenase E1 component beta subunit
MARILNFADALKEAMIQELQRDPTVVVYGEDVVGGTGGKGQLDVRGGTFGVTKGLFTLFPDRVLDTPITEAAMFGATVGAAVTGLRPVCEIMFIDFYGAGFDGIMNQAAKFRYMFGGTVKVPLVFRGPYGAGRRVAGQHSQSPYSIFTHIPGLKVVVPANPYEAKGLLTTAIRDDDPVMFLEHKLMYADKGEVPEEPYTIPFKQARVVRPGKDVTIVAIGRQVQFSEKAAETLAAEGIDCEIIDPRTLSPLDEETFFASVRKTGRLVVADEDTPRCGMASEFAGLAARYCFHDLKAPVVTVTEPHATAPFSSVLEDLFIPSPDMIADAVRRTVESPVGTPA